METGMEKKSFYKFLVLILAISLVTGCSSSGEESASVSSDTTATASTTTSEETEEVKEEPKEEVEEEVKKEDVLYKVGEKAVLEGVELTVNSVEYTLGGEWDREDLENGEQYVVANVTITNKTDYELSYSDWDFEINQDGVKTGFGEYLSEAKNELGSGELDVGATITGNIYAKANPDKTLKLEYLVDYWGDDTIEVALN